MLQLSITQGSALARVLQLINLGGSRPTGYLVSDTLTASCWVGQSQSPIFAPSVSWFMGLNQPTLISGGNAYSSSPMVMISGGGATTNATAIASVSGGVIQGITLTSWGDGYLSSPTITITDSTGTGAQAVATPALGWQYGLVLFQVSNTQSALLTDIGGTYHANISLMRGATTWVVGNCLLQVVAAPGTATNTVTPYCTFTDLMRYAPWLKMLVDVETSQEGFYNERLEAKQWMDNAIVKAYRGTAATWFGDPGRSAHYWSGIGGPRRTVLPSYWIINMLSAGIVNTVTITAPGSGYTYANMTFSGGGAPAAGTAQATAVTSGGAVISASLTNRGYGYTSVPTIAITGPPGSTGATATCTIVPTVLMLRPHIIRVCSLKAAGLVGFPGQVGRNNTFANYGAMCRDMASAELTSITAELDLNADGYADLGIPLGATNTIFT
jgi:hypothetical protein